MSCTALHYKSVLLELLLLNSSVPVERKLLQHGLRVLLNILVRCSDIRVPQCVYMAAHADWQRQDMGSCIGGDWHC